MRTAFLADIHANLEALQAVCRAGRQRGVDEWVCLGDIVGYGADPGPCLGQVRALTGLVVLGNHDAATAGLLDPAGFNDWAREAVEWTAGALAPEERAYLAGRPFELVHRQALCAHADPGSPAGWEYVDSAAQVGAILAGMAQILGFIGHTHRPFAAVAEAGEARFLPISGGAVALPASRRCLANAGSVGQPRDQDPRACLLLWDDERGTLEFVRCEYDLAAAQKKILDAGLPPLLAARLAGGY